MPFRPANLVHTDEGALEESTLSPRETGSLEPGPLSSAVERRVHIADVVGSIPTVATIRLAPNKNFKDLVGLRFGLLTVLERWSNTSRGGARWRCACDCGRWSVVRATLLMSGHTTSCGHIAREKARQLCAAKRKHGWSAKGAEYTTWQTMKDRCYNPRSKGWKRYGGRGIKVCERWRNDFAAFLLDVGQRPKPGFTLDRIDNDGDYAPGNCRWTTARVQGNNRSTNRLVGHNGRTMTITEWARHTGIEETILRWRLSRWPVDRALETPVRHRKIISHSRRPAA